MSSPRIVVMISFFGDDLRRLEIPLGRRVGDTLGSRSALRFDADAVVHCSTNPLFAAEITLGSLYRNVPEKELDLLQLIACRMAQLRA